MTETAFVSSSHGFRARKRLFEVLGFLLHGCACAFQRRSGHTIWARLWHTCRASDLWRASHDLGVLLCVSMPKFSRSDVCMRIQLICLSLTAFWNCRLKLISNFKCQTPTNICFHATNFLFVFHNNFCGGIDSGPGVSQRTKRAFIHSIGSFTTWSQ